MTKKGIYRGGKVYHRAIMISHLHSGNLGVERPGVNTGTDIKSYDVINRLDMWPSGNQEVEFEVIDGKAIVRKLGKILDNDEADRELSKLF